MRPWHPKNITRRSQHSTTLALVRKGCNRAALMMADSIIEPLGPCDRLRSSGYLCEGANAAERRRRFCQNPILPDEIYIASPTPRFK